MMKSTNPWDRAVIAERRTLAAVAVVSAGLLASFLAVMPARADSFGVLAVQPLPMPLVGIPRDASGQRYRPETSRPRHWVRPTARVIELDSPAPGNNCGPHAFESLSGRDRGACYGM